MCGAMAALPYLFTGLQIAAPAAFLGAMVGEFTGAERGMGVLTVRAIRALDVEMTWGLATVATAVAILAYVGIGALARRVLLEAPPGDPRRAGPWQREGVWAGWIDTGLVILLALGGWAGAIWAFGLNPFFAKGPGDVLDALVFAPDAAATRATIGAALAGERGVYLIPGYIAGLLAGGGARDPAHTRAGGPPAQRMPLAIALRSVPIVTTGAA